MLYKSSDNSYNINGGHMSKTANWKQMIDAAGVDAVVQQYKQVFVNKYYDLFCSRFDVEGFDYRYLKTFRAKLFSKGSVWIRKNAFTGEAICCDYAASMYDWNNLPVKVQLITTHRAPESIIPVTPQIVDKDGVIVWLRPGEKGLAADVDYYIGKLAEAETLITINLALQRAPWILTSESENYSKLKDILVRIFSNAPAVITDIDKNELEAIKLDAPWLVDKLAEYEERLENKLKTLLGLDNQGGYINRQQQNLDTTNSNNDEINSSQDSFFKTLKDGIDRANKVLGLNISIKENYTRAEQVGVSPESTKPTKKEEDADEN